MLCDNGIIHNYNQKDHIEIGAPISSDIVEVIPAKPHRPIIMTIGYGYPIHKDKIVISDIDTPDHEWETRYDIADPGLFQKILQKVKVITAQSDVIERARWIQKSSGKS